MSGDDPGSGVDPLAETLHALRMTGTFYCRSELSDPWGLALPAEVDAMWFHVVSAGRCWLEVDGDDPRPLGPGDFALLPHGAGHRLVSRPGQSARDVMALTYDHASDRYAVLRHGGGGSGTHVVCGTVSLGHPAASRLVALLPRTVVVDGTPGSPTPQSEWMHTTMRLIAAEGEELRPGGAAVITRLSDVLVVQALRSWLASPDARGAGWLGALRDPQVGLAMSLVHRDPARPWSVASLAHEVAMSRSALAARFSELAGEPVMQYVTRWRMQLAYDLLRQDDVPVAALAGRVGYASEAAFSRAFKRTLGLTPGAVRRELQP